MHIIKCVMIHHNIMYMYPKMLFLSQQIIECTHYIKKFLHTQYDTRIYFSTRKEKKYFVFLHTPRYILS